MCKCIYKSIADNLDADELKAYYENHLPCDVSKHFGFDQKYFVRIFDYLGIPRKSNSEYTKLQARCYDQSERYRKIAESNRGKKRDSVARQHMSEAAKRNQNGLNNLLIGGAKTRFQKGNEPHNKGQFGVYHRTQEAKRKDYETKKKNHSFNTSHYEKDLYDILRREYDINDIETEYNRDQRYPFRCDFYIKSIDTFIELNIHYTHESHPFDIGNESDIKRLETLRQKQYNASIDVWTQRDVQKLNTAVQNKLNYVMIYRNLLLVYQNGKQILAIEK